MSGDDFLSRWSRRKLEVRREEDEEAPAPETPAEPPPVEEDAELSPEELAALPKIEELTPETDITVFLRKGVPQMLRNAALRRMWSLDPAIRDYVSEAREYAYDWNVPGGVPGAGPLLPTDDPQAMVERLFTKWRSADDPGDDPVEEGGRALDRDLPADDEKPAEPVAAPPSVSPSHHAVVAAPAALPSSGLELPQPAPSAARVTEAHEAQPHPAHVRRHGGAMPH